MKAEIEIQLDNRTGGPLDVSFEPLIAQVLIETLNMENTHIQTEISISLVGDDEMRALNKKHRGLDKTTDVLSFPLHQQPDRAGEKPAFLSKGNVVLGNVALGDIVISIDKMFAQAAQYGHAPARELGFLVAHGVLHLLGYDHINDTEAQEMAEKQEQVLQKLNLTRAD